MKEIFNTNNHYVPRCYLKNFCSRKKVKGNRAEFYIFAYQRKSNKFIEPNIRSIASERGLYEMTLADTKEKTKLVENFFTELEGKASPILEDLIENGCLHIDNKKKYELSNFFAFLHIRNIAFREKQKRLASNTVGIIMSLEASRKENFFKLTQKAGINFKSKGEFENLRNSMIEFNKNFRVEMRNGEDFLLKEALKVGQEIAPYFFAKNWNIIKSPTKKVFITTDNPVVLIGNKEFYSYGFPNSAILIPICPQKSLLLTNKKYKKNIFNVGEKTINSINKYILNYAHKFLFSNLKSNRNQRIFDLMTYNIAHEPQVKHVGPYMIATIDSPDFLKLDDILNSNLIIR